MSQKLAKAVAQGKVVAHNPHAGSVVIYVPLPDGGERRVLIPAHEDMELVPKHTEPHLIRRSRNLQKLLYRGAVRIR